MAYLPFIDILVDFIGCCHCDKKEQASKTITVFLIEKS